MKTLRFILVLAVLFLLAGIASTGWVQQQSGTTANLGSVYFINAQTGWVKEDTNFILWTTDGGASWERRVVDPTGRGYYPIRFRSSLLGFAGAGNRLYRSSDCGVTWQHLPQTLIGYALSLSSYSPRRKAGWSAR